MLKSYSESHHENKQSHQRFDQCGIVMYLDSVVTNNGYSDWATTAIPADIKTMWYRFSRRADAYMPHEQRS